MDGLVLVAQHRCVIGIGGNTADAEQDQGFEGTDILVSIPELLHIIVIVATAGGCALVALRHQLPLLNIHSIHNGQKRIVIEVHIGQGSKQSFHDDSGSRITDNMLVALSSTGQTDQRTSQLVLNSAVSAFLPQTPTLLAQALQPAVCSH